MKKAPRKMILVSLRAYQLLPLDLYLDLAKQAHTGRLKVLSMRRYPTLPKILMSLPTHASRSMKNMHGNEF